MGQQLDRNQAIDLLERFKTMLMKDGYLDFDFIEDETMDKFITSEWFCKTFPICLKKDQK